MTPLENYAIAKATMSSLLLHVHESDLTRPTPCAGWDVQGLLDHIVDNTAFFAGAGGVVSKEHPPLTSANLGGEFTAVAGDVLAGFGADGMLDKAIETPFGTFPGAVVLAVGVADLVTHCWDLAQAIDAPLDVEVAVIEDVMAAWRGFISTEYRENGMFGAEQPCGPAATPLDRVAAFAGRSVSA